MSIRDTSEVTGNVKFLGAVAVICFVIAAIVVVVIAVPEGANKGSLIALLVGMIPSTLTALAVFARVESNSRKVEEVASNVHALRNGEMAGKLDQVLSDRGVGEDKPPF